MDAAYDRIGRIEDKIEKLKHKLLRMKQGIHSSDNICLILNHFDRLYEKMNYEERRTLCRQFIQRIEVFPEKGDDKRILKSITFRFPVYFDLGGNQEEDDEDTPDENGSLYAGLFPSSGNGGRVQSHLCGDKSPRSEDTWIKGFQFVYCPGKAEIWHRDGDSLQ